MTRALLIDDDERLTEMLATWLGARGVVAIRRATGGEGLAAARPGEVDIVVLDGMLPDLDGLEVLRRIRAASDLPVILLTARGDEVDRIVGLELGADDYLGKPFNPRELLARMSAILRRRAPRASGGTLTFGRLEIDIDAREVRLDGTPRPLTAHQFALLLALAEHPGRVWGREQLMARVRGEALEPFDRSIDVHISRIRAAIEDDPAHPRRITTVRGAGYVFHRERAP
jgi:two-component system phosphate regulon response regulator OmpR